MTNDTKETLETLERLIVRDAVSVHAAIQAAYQLGRVDGQIEMAAIGQSKVAELLAA